MKVVSELEKSGFTVLLVRCRDLGFWGFAPAPHDDYGDRWTVCLRCDTRFPPDSPPALNSLTNHPPPKRPMVLDTPKTPIPKVTAPLAQTPTRPRTAGANGNQWEPTGNQTGIEDPHRTSGGCVPTNRTTAKNGTRLKVPLGPKEG